MTPNPPPDTPPLAQELWEPKVIAPVRAALASLPPGFRVLIACSAGPDSTALAASVHAARPDLTLVIAHVRHGLREEDGHDAALARILAERLGRPYTLRELHLRDQPDPVGNGPEDAARHARWEALGEMAREQGCPTILVGHTADDQAETILLRLARGTGPEGLAGMAPELYRWLGGGAPLHIMRPLLGIRREDVHGFAYAQGVEIAVDPTNRDPDQRRARARHHALPALSTLRPDEGDVVGAITRLGDLQRDQSDLLQAYLATIPLAQWGNAVLIPAGIHTTMGLPEHVLPGLLAGLVRRAMALVGRYPQPDRARIDTIVRMAPGERLDLPHGRVCTRDKFGWLITGTMGYELTCAIGSQPPARIATTLPPNTMGYELALPRDSQAPGRPGQDGYRVTIDAIRDVPGQGASTLAQSDALAAIHRLLPPLPWSIDLPATLGVPGAIDANGRVRSSRDGIHAREQGIDLGALTLRTRDDNDRALRKILQRYPAGLRHHLPILCYQGEPIAIGPHRLPASPTSRA